MFRMLKYTGSKDFFTELLTRNSQLLRCYVNSAKIKPDQDVRCDNNGKFNQDAVHSLAVSVTETLTINVSQPTAVKNVSTHDFARKQDHFSWNPSPHIETDKVLCFYKKLSKFRLTSLVVITAMGGYAMAPASFDLTSFALCSLGTGLVSAAANAINQYHEVPFDSQMSRTKNRVLVTGQLTSIHAIGYATVSAIAGLSVLYFGVNDLTAALGAANLFLYTSVYTPLKRISVLNTWIGSVVGAIPPLMGWAGCNGTLDGGAWILAGVLYAWQFPHFNALSWNLRPDYSRAGYRMMAVTNPSLCRSTAFKYTLVINGLSLLAPAFDLTSVWFVLETLPLNAYFSYLALQFYRKSDSRTSRKLFRYSLLHLPLIMFFFLLNKKHWSLKDTSDKKNKEMQQGELRLLDGLVSNLESD